MSFQFLLKLKSLRNLLLDELSNKHKRLKQLNKQLDEDLYLLNNNVTWMKSKCIVYSINILINAYIKKTQVTHNKNLDRLFKKKQEEDGLKENPNNAIWNLTWRILSNEECQVLRYGRNHGIATNLKESDILASSESVWDQISRNNICKESQYHVERAKNSVQVLAFNLTDFDNNQVYKDKKKLEIIKNLRKELVILKQDKGNGVVLVRTIDYYNAVENLFSDPSKFKQIYNDPTPTRLTSLQRYLKQLNKRGELPDAVYNTIRPKHAKIARAHGLPKVHKAFDDIPPFRPIIDTIGTIHSSVGKYLSEVLYPLTQNQFSIKDSFDAANRINSILPEVKNSNDLVFVSLDVVFLFTNVPLKKTVYIILKRVYNNKEILTTLSKRSLKKLILHTCQKKHVFLEQ